MTAFLWILAYLACYVSSYLFMRWYVKRDQHGKWSSSDRTLCLIMSLIGLIFVCVLLGALFCDWWEAHPGRKIGKWWGYLWSDKPAKW